MQETVNQRVARYRKLRDLNQAELAEKIGMKASTYSQMERSGNISAQRLLDIALVLKVDVGFLLYGDPEWIDETITLKRPPVVDPYPRRPEPDISDVDIILTNKDERIIKMYHDFDKEERAEFDRFLNDLYQKSRDKKKKKIDK